MIHLLTILEKASKMTVVHSKILTRPKRGPAMNEDHKSILQQSEKVCDESQSLRDNAKIITAESGEAAEQARQAIIKSRLRRKKRTVIIK